MINLIKIFLCAGIATIFFAYVMKTPKRLFKIIFVISGIGYILFVNTKMDEFLACFISILFISVSGEILSKIYDTPSLTIVFPSVIPIVPGIGLYETILSLINKEMDNFVKYGIKTVIISLIIASVIAVVKYVFKVFKGDKNEYKNRKNK